jgi:hypothetical protein
MWTVRERLGPHVGFRPFCNKVNRPNCGAATPGPCSCSCSFSCSFSCMSTLPSLSGLSLAPPLVPHTRDDDLLHAAPIGAGPSVPTKSADDIIRTQALIADSANKQTDRTVAFVWDDDMCPANASDDVESITSGPLRLGELRDFVVTPRNVTAFWYKACGATSSTRILGDASEAAGYRESRVAWVRARALYTRTPPRGPDPGDEPPLPPPRTRANDWEYFAFPADLEWIRLPLFNPWHLNGRSHKSGFHDIVLYADMHPSGKDVDWDFSSPAGYPHQHGPPHDNRNHETRPYYTPYSREDATELYYHGPAREHTRFDTSREVPDPNNPLPLWDPSVEHIVPKNRFPKGPVAPENGVFPMRVPAGPTPVTPPGQPPMRYAYGPNDPNGWMLERNATNTLRGNSQLLFHDGDLDPDDPGKGWIVPASERGRVARKWLYMMATYKPMKGELLAPIPGWYNSGSGSDYAISRTHHRRSKDILEAARTPIHPDEIEADIVMRETYGWGNPLLDKDWQGYFLGPSRDVYTPPSTAFYDVVFRRPASLPPPAGRGGRGRGRGRGLGP